MSKEKRNIIVTLQCFVKKGNKYLMLHRNGDKKIMPNVWMAPGGKREFHEGLFECARREIKEETGLEIKNIKIKVTGNGYLEDLKQELYFHFLIADIAGGKLLKNPSDGELLWLTPKEIAVLPNLLSELNYILPFIFRKSDKVVSFKATYKKGNTLTDFVLES